MPYLLALALTLAIEVPVVTITLGWCGVDRQRAVLLAVAANLLTHPLFGLVVSGQVQDSLGALGLGLAEAAVVAVEAAVYWAGSRGAVEAGPAVAVAALANGLALIVGLVVLLATG